MSTTSRLQAYSEMIAAGLSSGGGIELSDDVVQALGTVPRHRLVERFYCQPIEDLMKGGPFQEYQVDPELADDAVFGIVYSDEALITGLDDEGQRSSSTSQLAATEGNVSRCIRLMDATRRCREDPLSVHQPMRRV